MNPLDRLAQPGVTDFPGEAGGLVLYHLGHGITVAVEIAGGEAFVKLPREQVQRLADHLVTWLDNNPF